MRPTRSWTSGPLVVGAATFGGIGGNEELIGMGLDAEAAWETLDEAVELGIAMVDTAERYAAGASERTIGLWLASRDPAVTERLRITTKVAPAYLAGGDERFDKPFISTVFAGSLERLGVDHVEFLLLHAPDDSTPVEESLEALESIREEGQAMHVGACNVDATHLDAALVAADRLGIGGYEVVQNAFSLLAPDDIEVQMICVDRDIAYAAYSPLAAGALTGKYRRDERPPAGTRMALRPDGYDRLLTPAVHDAIDRLGADAAELGVSCGGLALAWVTSHGAVSAAVVGPSRRVPHLGLAAEALCTDVAEDRHRRIEASFRNALEQ